MARDADPAGHDEAANRAARYRAGLDDGSSPHDDVDDSPARRPRRPEDQALWVDQQIRAAIERGEFDDLPHAGRPLPHVDTASNPNWWLERLIERERISGVLPEALQLRKDDATLDAELDRVAVEAEVRRRLEEFNARILEARRQLQGGPPVITALRDVEVSVAAWRERRRRLAQAPPRPSVPSPRRRWWRRRSPDDRGR